MLPIGEPGNVADARDGADGLGSVSYTYYLDKLDVTNAQYIEFLNAKASAVDPYGLYDSQMATFDNGGIRRSASAPFTYTAKTNMANKPVVFVSWFDAIRFTNWLTNGQGSGDTESGSYLITGGGPNNGVATIPDAAQRALWSTTSRHYLLPTANEWYKAGFYKGGGSNAGYLDYPFANGQPPRSVAPGGPAPTTGGNVLGPTGTALPGPVFLTNVGAYNNPGPYGQFDMGGNVSQLTDSQYLFNMALMDIRGGAWNEGPVDFKGTGGIGPSDSSEMYVGFRVMMVPEPDTLALSAVVTSGLLTACRWRRRPAR